MVVCLEVHTLVGPDSARNGLCVERTALLPQPLGTHWMCRGGRSIEAHSAHPILGI